MGQADKNISVKVIDFLKLIFIRDDRDKVSKKKAAFPGNAQSFDTNIHKIYCAVF